MESLKKLLVTLRSCVERGNFPLMILVLQSLTSQERLIISQVKTKSFFLETSAGKTPH